MEERTRAVRPVFSSPLPQRWAGGGWEEATPRGWTGCPGVCPSMCGACREELLSSRVVVMPVAVCHEWWCVWYKGLCVGARPAFGLVFPARERASMCKTLSCVLKGIEKEGKSPIMCAPHEG